MKTIEEKAKAYDEALERAKNCFKDDTITNTAKSYVKDIFPELAESEDEKIRKDVKRAISVAFDYSYFDKETANNCLAWLEKQGEQNTNYKTMSVKFICKKDWHGIGDYCYGKVYNGYPCEKEQRGYDVYDDNHIPTFCDEDFIDEYFRIVTGEKQGEQKPVVIIPKFRIGDNIKTTNEEPLTITKIDDKGYWSEDLLVCDFDDAAKWELVEQKPADKVEPKFKAGEWITNSFETVQITGYDIDYGYQVDYKGNLQHRDTDIIEKEYDLWTIQDAKPGDVLVDVYGDIGIFEKRYGYNWHTYCYLGNEGRLFPEGGSHGSICYPATKEQRDLLFQKMKEAGYEWDSEKKELKKIGQKPDNEVKPFDEFAGFTDFESTLADICIDWVGKEMGWKQYVKENAAVLLRIAIEKFNSVQNTPFEQKSATWGEEDEETMSELLSFLLINTPEQWAKYGNWLKSLKERYTWKPSEELDEASYRVGIKRVLDNPESYGLTKYNWKPSDEQIGVIEAVINNRSFQRRHLDSLYKQLKKLKGE